MAEKQEKQLHGLNKSTMTLISLVIALFAAKAFWFDRGSAQAEAAASHNYVVENNIGRITEAEKGISKVTTDLTEFKEETTRRFSDGEKTQIALQKDQQAILTGLNGQSVRIDRVVNTIDKLAALQIKSIESDAEIKAWIKSIDKVD